MKINKMSGDYSSITWVDWKAFGRKLQLHPHNRRNISVL